MGLSRGIFAGAGGSAAVTVPFSVKANVIPLALRAYGDGIWSARQDGGDFGKQEFYGLVNAALNVGAGRALSELENRLGPKGALQIIEKMSQTSEGRLALAAVSGGREELIRSFVLFLMRKSVHDSEESFGWEDAESSFSSGAMFETGTTIARNIISSLK